MTLGVWGTSKPLLGSSVGTPAAFIGSAAVRKPATQKPPVSVSPRARNEAILFACPFGCPALLHVLGQTPLERFEVSTCARGGRTAHAVVSQRPGLSLSLTLLRTRDNDTALVLVLVLVPVLLLRVAPSIPRQSTLPLSTLVSLDDVPVPSKGGSVISFFVLICFLLPLLFFLPFSLAPSLSPSRDRLMDRPWYLSSRASHLSPLASCLSMRRHLRRSLLVRKALRPGGTLLRAFQFNR